MLLLRIRDRLWKSRITEATRSNSNVLLKGSNFPTWKLQCHMVLMKEGLCSIYSFWHRASSIQWQNVAYLLLVEIEPWHSSFCPLNPHCCTYSVIWMTQLLCGEDCQISFKTIRRLISCSYGKGCIVSSWEKGIQCRSTFAFWLRYLMSWQLSVAQLRRKTELSTCSQVCQSPTASLSLPWRQVHKRAVN